MSDNSEEPEVELCEEVVGDEYCNSPVRDQTSSVVPVAVRVVRGSNFYDPTRPDLINFSNIFQSTHA